MKGNEVTAQRKLRGALRGGAPPITAPSGVENAMDVPAEDRSQGRMSHSQDFGTFWDILGHRITNQLKPARSGEVETRYETSHQTISLARDRVVCHADAERLLFLWVWAS